MTAIRAARAAARERARNLAGTASPVAGGRLTIDLDGVLVTAHSDKEGACPTWKRTFGFHPLRAFADHGPQGSGEPLAVLLRPENAGSNTVADHIEVTRQALLRIPKRHRRGGNTLIRTDSAGGAHDFLAWLTRRGRWLSYSVGFTITDRIHAAILRVPRAAWTPAYDADGRPRDGAWIAEVTDMLDLTAWPKGMRVIVRKERHHPGAQLRITDVDATAASPSPPTREAGSSRTSNSATADAPAPAPAPRNASARRGQPGCGTCPCTASHKTGCGMNSFSSPASWLPGSRCSP